MSGALIKLGLLSSIASALTSPVLPCANLDVRDAPKGTRPSWGASGRGRRCGKGGDIGGGKSSGISTRPTYAAFVADNVTVRMASTNYITVTIPRSTSTPPGADDAYLDSLNRLQSASASATSAFTTTTTLAALVASTPSSSSYPSGLGSQVKGGIAYETVDQVQPFIGKPRISWCYNWNADPGSFSGNIEYIPTLWGLDDTHLSTWVSSADAAIRKGATAVVGFNEPDHHQQANLDYNQAASAYKYNITDKFSGKATLVSPSVTNGPAPMGLSYLQNFMSACIDCGIQAINVHWYDSSHNIEYFKSHIRDAYDQFQLPIWVTEFGTTDGNDQTFLSQVLPWLDSQPFVERYAYFMAKEGVLLSSGSLSAAGQVYASG